MLLHSWTRRKRFEARLLASELGKLLTPPRPSPGMGGGRVAPDDMLELLGINL